MLQDPMATLARRPEVAVVVIGGPDTLFNATRRAAANIDDVAVVQSGIIGAASLAASRRPFAIVVSDELYAHDSSEFDALARAVGATVISTPTKNCDEDSLTQMLEPRIAWAHGARDGQSGQRIAAVTPTDQPTISIPVEADGADLDRAEPTPPSATPASETPPSAVPASGAPRAAATPASETPASETPPSAVPVPAAPRAAATPPSETPASQTPRAAGGAGGPAMGRPAPPQRDSPRTQPIFVEAALRQSERDAPQARAAKAALQAQAPPPPVGAPTGTVFQGSAGTTGSGRAEATPVSDTPPSAVPLPPPKAIHGPASESARAPAADAQARRERPEYARRIASPVPAPISKRPDPPDAQDAAPPPSPVPAASRQAKLEAELSPKDRARLEANRRAIAAQRKRTETEDHFSLLGVKPGADPAEVDKAFGSLARAWDPSKVPSVLEDMRREVALIYSRMLEARHTLTDPERRAQYVGGAGSERPPEARSGRPAAPAAAPASAPRESAAQPDSDAAVPRSAAQAELQRAARSQQRLRDRSALDHVDRALAMEADNPNVHALRGYLLSQSAQPDSLKDGCEALACIDRALALDARCERAHHFRGMVLKRAGRLEEAMESFERALQLDESNVDAKRELRLYAMRRGDKPPEPPGTSPGLLGRLLGKK